MSNRRTRTCLTVPLMLAAALAGRDARAGHLDLSGDYYMQEGLDGLAGEKSGTPPYNWDQILAWVSEALDAEVSMRRAADRFGSAMAVGDFNCDGFPDLAIGVPGEHGVNDVNLHGDDSIMEVGAGAVVVVYGDAGGLDTYLSQAFSQASLPGKEEPYDGVGFALAAGNFNGDHLGAHECDDLAIGAPGEDVPWDGDPYWGGKGMVHALYGGAYGLRRWDQQVFDQSGWFNDAYNLDGTPEAGDRFGYRLAAGDFNGDGRDDLAISVNESKGSSNTFDLVADYGEVYVVPGGNYGLTRWGHRVLSQDEMTCCSAEDGDRFGDALAAGDFNGDGIDDLVVGVPGENDHGAVQMFLGGVGANMFFYSWYFSQNTDGVPGGGESGDDFGAALAAGDIDGDGLADLAVGVPGEDGDDGGVHIFFGTPAQDVTLPGGLTAHLPGGFGTAWTQALWGETLVEMGHPGLDHGSFGAALAIADLDGDGRDDLIAGAPTYGSDDRGAIVVYGAATTWRGVWSSQPEVYTQNTDDVEGGPEEDDNFGQTLAAADFDGDSLADVIVGIPGEDDFAGMVQVFPGLAD